MAGLVLSSSTTVVVPVSNVVVVVVAGSRDVGAFVGDVLGNPEGGLEEGTPVGGGVGSGEGLALDSTTVGFTVGAGAVGLTVTRGVGLSVSGIFGGVGLPMLEFWRGQSSQVAVGLSHLQPATRQVSALRCSSHANARPGSSGSSSSGTKMPKLSARYGRTAAAP